MNEIEIAWLAGYLEGEGCFGIYNSKNNDYPSIHVATTDLDILYKVKELMNTNSFSSDLRTGKNGWKRTYRTISFGEKSITTMKEILPHMGERRTKKILEIIEAWKNRKETTRAYSRHPNDR